MNNYYQTNEMEMIMTEQEKLEQARYEITRSGIIGMILGAACLIAAVVFIICSGVGIEEVFKSVLDPKIILFVLTELLLIVCAPFGWVALNKIGSRLNFVLLMSIPGWLFWGIMKIMLSVQIGIIAAAVEILRYCRLKARVQRRITDEIN